MVVDLNVTTLVVLLCGVSTFIFIMLLPALIELKKPKDAGPRAIADCGDLVKAVTTQSIRVVDLEDGQKFDQAVVKRIADIIAVLPNLEA